MKSKAIRIYQGGLSMNAVAKEVGVTGPTVARWLEEAGVAIRNRRPTYTDQLRREAITLYVAREMSARSFFSYYGAKWTGAKHYGPPRRDLVIEPFAGSACYSTRWACQNVRLYDVSPDVCDLWAWLIGCSADDVARIPDVFDDFSEVAALDRGPQLLVRFWVSKGRAAPSQTLSPWYFQWRSASDCRVWGPAVKRRIITQKPILDGWTIERKPWWEIEMVDAHWHVDPPYNNAAGSRYPHSGIDYPALARWCRALPGAVDVCENVGADWLPFEPIYEVVTSRGRCSGAVSKEAVWRIAA